jgi:hypothetical protein
MVDKVQEIETYCNTLLSKYQKQGTKFFGKFTLSSVSGTGMHDNSYKKGQSI